MEAETPNESREAVRCLACHAVYELPTELHSNAAPACPDCGASEWLAVTIPIPQTDPLEFA